MTGPLASARIKVKRADKHLDDLQNMVEAYLAREPYTVVREEEDQPRRIVWRLRIKEPIPDIFSAVIGDVIHNLRCALDHLTWSLVIANSEVPGEHTMFPVLSNPKELDSAVRGRVKGASPRAMRLIKRLKPYDRGIQPFWIIHRLDNIDKHRLLLALFASSETVHLNLVPVLEHLARELGKDPAGFDPMTIGIRPKDRCVEDGAIFFAINNPSGVEMEPERFDVSIAVQERGVVECEPIAPLLPQLVNFTKRVLDIFERFCF